MANPCTSIVRCMVLVLTVTWSVINGCPDVENIGKLRFTYTHTSIDYTLQRQLRSIRCCAAGYSSIQWYRLNKTTSEWEGFPFGRKRGKLSPTLKDNNQTLIIKYASMDDNTTFRCNVTNSQGESLVHNMTLFVLSCEYRTEGPLPIQPKNGIVTIPTLGGTVDLFCEGYFGCGVDFRVARWMIVEGNHEKIDPTDIDPHHFNTTDYARESNSFIGSKLTIFNVGKQDLHRTFLCELISAQEIKGYHNKTVHLVLDPGAIVVIRPIIITVSVALVIGILIGVLRMLYWPQILLFYRVHIVSGKTVIEVKDETERNAFLYHADEDEKIARIIKEKLEKRNYEVKLTSDVRANVVMLSTYEEESRRSARVIFLYSENLLKDKISNFFLLNLMSSRLQRKLLFIIINKAVITQDQVADMMKTAEENPQADQGQFDNQGQGHLDTDFLEDDYPAYEHQNLDIIKFWKILPRLYFPSENDSARKHRNFWCELQLKIPRFQHQVSKTRQAIQLQNNCELPVTQTDIHPPSESGYSGSVSESGSTSSSIDGLSTPVSTASPLWMSSSSESNDMSSFTDSTGGLSEENFSFQWSHDFRGQYDHHDNTGSRFFPVPFPNESQSIDLSNPFVVLTK